MNVKFGNRVAQFDPMHDRSHMWIHKSLEWGYLAKLYLQVYEPLFLNSGASGF